MWTKNWRNDLWAKLDQPWDLIIVGGGIVGAGILREASRLKLHALLVEQRDFASGTSSRSSKLVHGGLRYLKTGDVRLTWESVHERQKLLKEGQGLIEPIGFFFTNFQRDKTRPVLYGLGLAVYDLMAQRWAHEHYDSEQMRVRVPSLSSEGLQGGYHYQDAQTDDARLVLRILQEAVARSKTVSAINYVAARELIRDGERVVGVRLHDSEQNRTAEVHARVVVNVSGAWADQLRKQMNLSSRIRPLRGSHLLFPSRRFPVSEVVSFDHPLDQRPVFILPWEGVTMVGTTDVDHHAPLDQEPGISPEEVAYLMVAVEYAFPSLGLTLADVLATFAGVRPVIDTGQADPSKASREHAVWYENGLLTVTGGKLTTFRVMAQDAIRAIPHSALNVSALPDGATVFEPVEDALTDLEASLRQRLLGRYGNAARSLVETALPGELTQIPGTNILWVELRWAARTEGVLHLDDLLLRRVRLGLLVPQGGASLLPRIREICQSELGWDDDRWEQEATRYSTLWHQHYTLPGGATDQDWREILTEVKADNTGPRAFQLSNGEHA